MKKIHIIIFVTLLFVTRFFNYKYWDITIGGQVANAFSLLIYIYVISKISIIKHSDIGNYIIVLLFFPVLAYLSYVFFQKGDVWQVRSYLYPLAMISIFFVYKVNKVKAKDITYPYIVVGLMVLLIQLYQQLDVNTAVFGVLSDDYLEENKNAIAAEIRNGIYRYRLDTAFYITFFCLYYCWDKYTQKKSAIYLILFILFAISIYLHLARQIMAVTLVVVVISYVLRKKSRTRVLFASIIFFSFLLFLFYNELFNSIMQNTSYDAEYRLLEYSFFWNKICESPIVFLFGHGYSKAAVEIQNNYGFYTSDIGIIGQMYYYGFLWVIAYVSGILYILVRYRNLLPLYIIMFLTTIFIDSVLISPFVLPSHIFTFITVLYLCDYHIKHQQRINPVLNAINKYGQKGK